MSAQTRPVETARETATIPGRTPGHKAAERFQTPDKLFSLLDGRSVMASGRLWRAEVFGIRDLSGHRWIQVGLETSDERRMVTLRIAAGGSLPQALTALASWLDGAAGDAVLSVA